MNAHLYGAPKGFPLGNLDPEGSGVMLWTFGTIGALKWQQRLSARIMGDDLFLRITHTIEGTDTSLREAIDGAGRYRVCMHVKPGTVDHQNYSNGLRKVLTLAAEFEDDGENQQEEGEKKAGARSSCKTCRDELGSCTICLTDYTTTIGRAEVREAFYSVSGRTGRVSYRETYAMLSWRGVPLIPETGKARTGRRWMASHNYCLPWGWRVPRCGGLEMGSPCRRQYGTGNDFSAALDGRDAAAFPPGWVRQK